MIACAALITTALASCSDDSSSADDAADTGNVRPGRDLGNRADSADGADVLEGCATRDDCDEGEVCDEVSGVCVGACLDDADCDRWERCDEVTGNCFSRAVCGESSECEANEACDSCLGVCVVSSGGAVCFEDENCRFEEFCDACIGECRARLELCARCADDRECGEQADACLDYATGGRFCGRDCGGGRPCPLGFRCDDASAQCVSGTSSCDAASACADDSECSGNDICGPAGLCVGGCIDDGACASGEVCSAGRCLPPCTNSDECPPGSECLEDGHCRRPGGCITSADCPEAETYCDRDQGVCVAGCEVDADCFSAGLECIEGSCVDRPCRGAYSCGFGQICNASNGECEQPAEDHCHTCDASDVNSCGDTNACVSVQDGEGVEQGDFCFLACSEDPLNVCPQGYACTELEVPTSGGGSEVRDVCARACWRNPV